MASATEPVVPQSNPTPPTESLPEPTGPEFCFSLILVILSCLSLHIWGHFLFDPLSWPHFGKELVSLRDALPIVQAVLIAGWRVLGPGHWYLRWPTSLALLVGI